MTRKEYYKFKRLLKAGKEDRDLALEMLNNINASLLMKTLLGKSLNGSDRYDFTDKFPEVKTIVGPWNDMFTNVNSLNLTKDEKKLFELELTEGISDVIKEHYPIIKNMEIKLEW